MTGPVEVKTLNPGNQTNHWSMPNKNAQMYLQQKPHKVQQLAAQTTLDTLHASLPLMQPADRLTPAKPTHLPCSM